MIWSVRGIRQNARTRDKRCVRSTPYSVLPICTTNQIFEIGKRKEIVLLPYGVRRYSRVEQLGFDSKLWIGSYVTATIVRVIAFSTGPPQSTIHHPHSQNPQISHDPSEDWGRHPGMGIRIQLSFAS
jgi:hypothetical protein